MAENSHHIRDKQELSGSEKSTLADLINHNMGLAHNLYQVQEIFTSLISALQCTKSFFCWGAHSHTLGGTCKNTTLYML